jgi:hypothetical protein
VSFWPVAAAEPKLPISYASTARVVRVRKPTEATCGRVQAVPDRCSEVRLATKLGMTIKRFLRTTS